MRHQFFVLFVLFAACLSAEPIPRIVVTFYDSKVDKDPYFSRAHQLAEMPCNHEGLFFEYYDIQKPLPAIAGRSDVLGILFWFDSETQIPYRQGQKLYDWTMAALDEGKKIVIMGYAPFQPAVIDLPLNQLNALWERLGVRTTGVWVDATFDVTLKRVDLAMTDFEREFPSVLSGFLEMIPISSSVECALVATSSRKEPPNTCLVATFAGGGYVADNYEAYYLYERGRTTRKWYINPFLFFRQAFGTATSPKPDTTTLSGRRIYYSHVDGDGWNNETEIGTFRRGTISAEVLYEEIYKKYPDLPVTVAPIGADVDLDWVALNASQPIARKIFELPHVEVASHTFTHPFDWGFFQDYRPEDEVPFLHLYPNGSWLGRGIFARVRAYFDDDSYYKQEGSISSEEILKSQGREEGKTFDDVYEVPRAFALQPFDLELEVSGSIDLINSFTPKDKQVALYQWSGDCRPFYEAIRAVFDANILNINGGDSRFDTVYSSYAWVAPLGREVKGLRQVYASNANENLYTDLWRSNFFGFNLLPQTFLNTEKPIRLRPMNLYYHIYSGQKYSSLKALEQNIEFVKTQEYIPIKASQFARLGLDYYGVQFEKSGGNQWIIKNRGTVSTIRFDEATTETVNLSSSEGVIGFRHFQGSLYVYLDAAAKEEAKIALQNNRDVHRHPRQPHFYLIASSWQVTDLNRVGQDKAAFNSFGFGKGAMLWNVPSDGDYLVTTNRGDPLVVSSENRQISFILEFSGLDPVAVEISKI